MRMMAVIPLDDPSPFAFENVYEDGDRWEKVVGCEGCEYVNRCCGKREGVAGCPLLVPGEGCLLHLQSSNRSQKPFNCIVTPAPNVHKGYCQQEWLCVKGSRKGQVRYIREPANVFHDQE